MTLGRAVLRVWFMAVAALVALPAAAIGQEVIKVGAVQAMRGPLAAAFIGMNAGLKDCFMIANEEGGINGKKLEYIMEETDYSVEDSKAKFEAIFAKHRPPVMFGNSTGLSLALANQIKEDYKLLYTSASFSAVLADAAKNPSIFMPGPTYGEQMGILLMHIHKTKPGARVALFYSDTEFGKDGIPYVRSRAKALGLNLVHEVVVKLGQKEHSAEIAKLKDANPDFVIFHGFVMEPVPEVIRGCRERGMTCKFMGTFWGATKTILDLLGPMAQGYVVVNPYSYWWSEEAPMIRKIRNYTAKNYPDVKYRDNYYMQGFASGLVIVEVLRRADKAGKLTFQKLVEALQSIKDLDTGGLTPPLTIVNNRFPVGRVWEANPDKGTFEPVSGWMTLK